ncbi:hypothetical protein AA313_de0201149 [Arthrobotrys entomopaga]|nr:hypothetical protein AA313_de0201149 [Arthrobotrys entomopaga]
MTSMGQNLFLIDSNRSIKVVSLKYHEGLPTPDSVAYEFPAHKTAVQGVKLMPPSAHIQAEFYTWSACGTILFWDRDGNHQTEYVVELEQPKEIEDDVRNELKVVEISDIGEIIVTGDRFGVLRVIKASDKSSCYAVKAHGAEIMSISIHEGEKATMISSCARDRTVQLFTKMKKPGSNWTHTQTLDDHTASVTGVMFMDNGTKLLSSSADRTIVIRDIVMKEGGNGDVEKLAFLATRTINLKSTPLHMACFSDSSPYILASTTGRQVYRFDITTGKEMANFKCVDENGESVILDSITPGREVGYGKGRLVAGISGTDKSIRIYDLQGNLVEREWGHTEGVTDVAMFETPGSGDESGRMTLISTGTDGTVMIWTYNAKLSGDADSNDGASMVSDFTASRAPIRKVLSKAEIMELTTRAGKDTDASSIASGKKDHKENKKDGLLGSDWAGVSDAETSSLRKVESQPAPSLADRPQTAIAPAPRPRLSERPKSAIINVSPPKHTKTSQRNSVAYMPKSGSTTNLIAPAGKSREQTAASRAPSRSSRTNSRAMSRNDTHNHTDTETASSSAGTVKRKLRLPTRAARETSPPTTNSSSNNPKSSVGGGSLVSRRASTSSRASSVRNNGGTTNSREASDAVNANALAEQMTRSLGVFRRRVEASQYAMRAEVRKELEKELLATLKCIGCAPLPPAPPPPSITPTVSVSGDEAVATSPKTLQPAFPGGDGLGIRLDDQMMALVATYSERLLSVVENRLPDLATSPRPSFSGPSGGGR